MAQPSIRNHTYYKLPSLTSPAFTNEATGISIIAHIEVKTCRDYDFIFHWYCYASIIIFCPCLSRSKVLLWEQESVVGGAELESTNILRRLQGIQPLGKELVMESNVTDSIHRVGARKCATKIARVWKMGHAVRNTVGMFPLYRAKIHYLPYLLRYLTHPQYFLEKTKIYAF
jgi:hypothetical protein